MSKAIDIEVTGLRKIFQPAVRSDPVVAIDKLDFKINRGEMVAIVGQTGCGKSTFLNILIGLDKPSEGSITIGGRKPYEDFDAFRGVRNRVSTRPAAALAFSLGQCSFAARIVRP